MMPEQATGKSVLSRDWTRQRSRAKAQWLHRAHCPAKKSDAALGATLGAALGAELGTAPGVVFGLAFGAVRSSPTACRPTASSNRDFSQPAGARPFYSTLVCARPSFPPGPYS